MNNEYVGAGPVSAQIDINKFNANAVGARIARPNKNKSNAKGITLIALIITIIIMLILAGITLNLTLGEHGIFKTAQNAGKEYKKAEIKEEIELAILDIQGEEIQNGNELTQERLKDKLPSKLNNITAEIKDNKITGTYKGYEYEIDDKFNVTIGKNNGNDDNEEETKGTLTISQDLQLWLNKTGEKITLQDILEDETVGEVKGLIPTLTAENVTRSEENGIVKYEDTTGGVASTSSEANTQYATWKAFNGIKDIENYTASKIGEAENYWLEYEFKENVKAIYARIQISTTSYHDGERTYKVQASNDGENWEDLTDEITHIGNVETMPEDVLELNTNKLYKKFRILVTSIGNSTGPAANCSGAYRFQLYGIKTKDNNATKEQIEQKLISSSNINIQLSNAVNMNSLMDRLMPKKETEELMLINENIRNEVLGSTVALSKTIRINPIVTEENITKIADKKYQDNLGNIMYSDDDMSIVSDIEQNYAWKAFNGKYIEGSWSNMNLTDAASSFSLVYEFTKPVFVYKFKYQLTANCSPSYYRKFNIQGSNDGENWVDLLQDHEMSEYRAVTTFEETPIYNDNNINKYKMFRIHVKEKSGNIADERIGEFEIYGIK